MNKVTGIALNALLCVTLLACASLQPKPGENADDGLVRVEGAMLDELYVAPNVPLGHYQRVMFDPIEIQFKDGWRQKHPDMSDREFEHFKTQLTTMFHEILVAELAQGGYTLAEAPAQDVLHLRAGLEGVDFAAPETGSAKSTVVYIDGEMTLRAQGFDSSSGALIARARDYEQDPEPRSAKPADRVRALRNAKMIFEKWAQELRSALDVAKVSAGARQLPQ
ncbi:MAG TPA: DUF3313 family protein [Steroidobacteraceae bacterium]